MKGPEKDRSYRYGEEWNKKESSLENQGGTSVLASRAAIAYYHKPGLTQEKSIHSQFQKLKV